MTPKVFSALHEVARSIEEFNKAVDAWIDELRASGDSPENITKFAGSAKAMRDSGHIYLAWAQHLANGLPQEEEINR